MKLQELNAGLRLGSDDGAFVQRSVLPSGIRVLTEAMPSLRSATIGLWVPVGSRHEVSGRHGASHYLEHLLFKGTERRSALEISLAFDEVGGVSNAATGKEYTNYYAQVRDAHVPMAIDVLCDMVMAPALRDADVEAERGVILDELASDDDDPDDVLMERFAEAVFGDHPMARPIGGTAQSVREMQADTLRDHYGQHYGPGELVVTAAGNITHEDVCRLVSEGLARSPWSDVPTEKPSGVSLNGHHQDAMDVVRSLKAQRVTVDRPTEQAHVVIGGAGITRADANDPAYSILTCVLGGDSSSRLNQELRERLGLTYSVHTTGMVGTDVGFFGITSGCAPENVQRVTEIMDAEWRSIARNGITEAERARVIGGISGYMALGLERTSVRMRRLGDAELFNKRFLDAEEEIARLNATTLNDVQELAAQLYDAPRHTCVVGPFEEHPISV